MIPAGALAHVQGHGWWYLLILSLFAAAGRVPASLILYFIADKSEDWLFGKGRRIFGVSHQQLQTYGQRFSGSRRDWVLLFLLNAVPIIPTSLLSLSCGFIKLRLKLFIVATFFGAAVNAVFYMSIGYGGLQAASALHRMDLALQVLSALVMAVLIGWLIYYWQKKKGR